MIGAHSDLILWHRARTRSFWQSYWLGSSLLVLLPTFVLLLVFLTGLFMGFAGLSSLLLPRSSGPLSSSSTYDLLVVFAALLISLPVAAVMVVYLWSQLTNHFLKLYFQRWRLIDQQLGLLLVVLDPVIYHSLVRASGELPPRGNPAWRTSFYSQLERAVSDAHLFPRLAGLSDPLLTFTRRTFQPLGCVPGGCCCLLVALALGIWPLTLAGMLFYFGAALIHRLNQLALREYLVFRLTGTPEGVASQALRRLAWQFLEEEGGQTELA